MAEELGIGTRGKFFEEEGIARDIVQNHAMQLLSLVAMEAPTSMKAKAIRDEKVKVLECIHQFDSETVHDFFVRGQYGPGFIQGVPVKGYREEDNVSPKSNIETYLALELHIDNWR